jgi:hypothetical protein
MLARILMLTMLDLLHFFLDVCCFAFRTNQWNRTRNQSANGFEVPLQKHKKNHPRNSETNGLHPETRLINSVTGRSSLNPEIPLDQTTHPCSSEPDFQKSAHRCSSEPEIQNLRTVAPQSRKFKICAPLLLRAGFSKCAHRCSSEADFQNSAHPCSSEPDFQNSAHRCSSEPDFRKSAHRCSSEPEIQNLRTAAP